MSNEILAFYEVQLSGLLCTCAHTNDILSTEQNTAHKLATQPAWRKTSHDLQANIMNNLERHVSSQLYEMCAMNASVANQLNVHSTACSAQTRRWSRRT